ncbi:hypothetical protein [Gymnodinialimonas hymeniacidonis]|uniref:hypothetical protein n=1 Tax=Gymnodinialimonas hymeniacidonis TaxID=3126508 RepID=UPI0034C6C4A8
MTHFSLKAAVLACGVLAACAPTASDDGLSSSERRDVRTAEGSAVTLSYIRAIAPVCVRYFRGEEIDAAALAAAGLVPAGSLNRNNVAFETPDRRLRDRFRFSSVRTSCSLSGPTTFLRDSSSLLSTVSNALAPLGFERRSGVRRGLNPDTTVFVAADMTIRIQFSDGGYGPTISLRTD